MRILTKFRLTFLVSTFLISLITQVVADTVLYCQSELATGFINKGTGWVEGSFEKKRFTVKFNDDFTTLEGFAQGPMDCKINFPDLLPTQLQCLANGGGMSALYDKTTKRFVFSSISIAGYVDLRTDSDNLYAGTCTKF
jgi:hypothetical protein